MNRRIIFEILEQNQDQTVEKQSNGEGRKFEATALGKLREEVNKAFDNFDVFKSVKSFQVVSCSEPLLNQARKSTYWNQFLAFNNFYHRDEQGEQKEPAADHFIAVIPNSFFWEVMFGYRNSIPPGVLEKLLTKIKLTNPEYNSCTLENTWFAFEDKYKIMVPPVATTPLEQLPT